MVNLDTNILVRWLIMDHEAQVRAVDSLFSSFTEEQPGFVSIVALGPKSYGS